MENLVHRPVMVDACLEWLVTGDASGVVLDLTAGGGGHADAGLARFPNLRWIGIDRDPQILELARERLAKYGSRVRLIHGCWGDLEEHLEECGCTRIQGAFLDLGVSSLQLDRAERGFSFQRDADLDMRFDPSSSDPTAGEILARATEQELQRWLKEYGEERYAGRIARAIVRERRRLPLKRTSDLVRLVEQCIPPGARRGQRIHPATRTFQALRIRVNRELSDLAEVLPVLERHLAPGGRLVVLAYHSLEDRIVKEYIREGERAKTLVRLTKKPVRPAREETLRNPRSRSARLRAAERCSD
jgi:16S rRNA (cytosine1402-N4)-methyltransferase